MRPFVLVSLLTFPLVSCSAGDAEELARVELKGQSYTVEIADELPEQVRGLMFRESLAPDRGMLFVYAKPEPQQFWMKNCKIGLDILYFDEHAKFINGHYGVPPCRSGVNCPGYPSERPARYVLELGANVGKKLGLQAGDVLTVPAGR